MGVLLVSTQKILEATASTYICQRSPDGRKTKLRMFWLKATSIV